MWTQTCLPASITATTYCRPLGLSPIILSLGALGSVLEAVKHMSNALANNSLLYKAGVYVARLDQTRVLQELCEAATL